MSDSKFNPAATLENQFSGKVYRQLAGLMPVGTVRTVHVDRFSLEHDDGIASQVLTTTGRFGGDPDVALYLQLDPADDQLWDSTNAGRLEASARLVCGRPDGPSPAVWIRGRDVHPHCRHNNVVAALVLVGTTLFMRVTSSAVKRAIRREDGADENAYSTLLTQVVRHYNPALLRFDGDPSRAARDGSSAELILDACVGRGTCLQFGDNQPWRPQDSNQLQILRTLLNVGASDDAQRRHRLTGKRLLKLKNGGWTFSERQMPAGYWVARDDSGYEVKVSGKGRVPEARWDFVPVMQELVRMHSAGASYVDIGRRMAELGVERRGQKRASSLRELVERGDLFPVAAAAKSFFVNASASPTKQRDIYLAKVRLWVTGTFRTHVSCDIRGRGQKWHGMTPVYLDDGDEYGYFDVTATWPWPSDPVSGEPLVSWGVAKELALSEKRLIAEIGTPYKTGGAAHQKARRRALSINEWVADGVRHSVQPRQYNSGQASSVIFANDETSRGSRRGWSVERANPVLYAKATFPLASLCSSVADAIERAALDLIGQVEVATMMVAHPSRIHPADDTVARAELIESQLINLRNLHQEQADEAEAQQLLGERRRSQGDTPAAERVEARAESILAEMRSIAGRVNGLERQQAETIAKPSEPAVMEEFPADLTVVAYLVAALRLAASANAFSASHVADTVERHLGGWRMTYDDSGVSWSAQLSVPLVDERKVVVCVSGVIDNVRKPGGGRAHTSGAVIAAQVLREGRDLSLVAASSGVDTSRRALMVRYLMPWMRDSGVTARGATCALLDHPIRAVQQLMFDRLSGVQGDTESTWSTRLCDHVHAVYTDPDLAWGDAAVLDDAVTIQRIVSAAASAGEDGLCINDVALAVGWDYRRVRELARPYPHGGVTRPRFLELHPTHRDQLRAISCPHCRQPGNLADRVAMLPEVADSGFAVLCRCGRPPVPKGHPRYSLWSSFAFPSAYTSYLYTRVRRTSLRKESQSGAVNLPPALELPIGTNARVATRNRTSATSRSDD